MTDPELQRYGIDQNGEFPLASGRFVYYAEAAATITALRAERDEAREQIIRESADSAMKQKLRSSPFWSQRHDR